MVMRQQVWIDRHVQGVLVGRVLLYWSGILIYFGLSISCFHWWQNPDWTVTDHLGALAEQALPCVPTLFLLLPLVVFDIVRLSNRFAGPVYRLRKHLAELNQNSQTSPLNFRDEDYWQQLAEPINLLQQKILVLEHQVQTLSFVHKSLAEGTFPTQDTESAAAAPDKIVEKIVNNDVVREPETEPLPTVPPISVLSGESPEAFVTLDAR